MITPRPLGLGLRATPAPRLGHGRPGRVFYCGLLPTLALCLLGLAWRLAAWLKALLPLPITLAPVPERPLMPRLRLAREEVTHYWLNRLRKLPVRYEKCLDSYEALTCTWRRPSSAEEK